MEIDATNNCLAHNYPCIECHKRHPEIPMSAIRDMGGKYGHQHTDGTFCELRFDVEASWQADPTKRYGQTAAEAEERYQVWKTKQKDVV